MIFHVTIEQAEDGWIVAECPALPGCVSQGRDKTAQEIHAAKQEFASGKCQEVTPEELITDIG